MEKSKAEADPESGTQELALIASRGRPRIPAEVERQILFESGHRCAVCGLPCPLERAHIVPWCKNHDHRPENLICLCANCHERADNERWGEATLRKYKETPWILRQTIEKPPASIKVIELELQINLENFAGRQDILIYAIAAFLGISPNEVIIRAIREGSVKVTIELPGDLADQLIEAHDNGDPDLERLIGVIAPWSLKEVASYMVIVPPGGAISEAPESNLSCGKAIDVMIKAVASLPDSELSQLASCPPLEVDLHIADCRACSLRLKETRAAIFAFKKLKSPPEDVVLPKSSSLIILPEGSLKRRIITIWTEGGEGGDQGPNPKGHRSLSQGKRTSSTHLRRKDQGT